MTRKYSDGYRRRTTIDPARQIAFEVLHKVTTEDAFANIALPKALREGRQSGRIDLRDAAFASELVYGTLRFRGYLDWVIGSHMDRALSLVDPIVVDLLRMGAHQILHMRVPDHAAVATTVDLGRELLTDGPARFINAVLRSLTRQSEEERAAALDAISDPTKRLATQYSHPEWMVEAFTEALRVHRGAPGEIEDLLQADNVAPIVTLVARPGLIHPADLADEAEDILATRVAPGDVSEYAVLLESGDPAALPSIREGLAGAQDEGSQLAALIAAEAPVEGSDSAWLDLCAGPGGKAALVASVGAGRGAHLVANEMHPHRARLVERACQALDNVEVVAGDGRTFGGKGTSWPLAHFDRVIIDAPCSGMGSMRRRPESRWRRSVRDFDDLLPLQRDLLRRGVELTRPGGVLTYVTCSPHVAETREQVEFLLHEGGVELLDTASIAATCAVEPLRGVGTPLGSGTTLQLWEHIDGTDLMFIACLRKR